MIVWLLLLALFVLFLLARLLAPKRLMPHEANGFLFILDWVNRLYAAIFQNLDYELPADMPISGPAILISNHTCGVDHTLLQAGNRRVLGFVMTKDWYDHPIIGPLAKIAHCIPVKREGTDAMALRAAMKALEDGRVVPIFPEGRIVPTSGRQLAEPQPGAAYIALRSGAPVIPAYISGTPPYEDVLTGARTISANTRVIFGPRVDLDDLVGKTDRASLQIATDRMMNAIRQLRHRIHPEWDHEPTWYPAQPDPPRPNRHRLVNPPSVASNSEPAPLDPSRAASPPLAS
jgi:1-acyl-sn-glycerol-3-phosphate acyltransferase